MTFTHDGSYLLHYFSSWNLVSSFILRAYVGACRLAFIDVALLLGNIIDLFKHQYTLMQPNKPVQPLIGIWCGEI